MLGSKGTSENKNRFRLRYSRLNNVRLHAYVWLLGLIVLALCPPSSWASSVKQVTVEEMLKNSELVFEGTVVGVAAHFASSGPHIETDIAFRVADVIKGSLTSPTIVLTFLGGTVGDITESIADMHMPMYKEHGIYFVESLQRKQVHPLYGWDQGHFVIRRNTSRREVVMTRKGRPILSLELGEYRWIGDLSTGVAFGIVSSDEETDDRALDIDGFKSELRHLVRRMQ